MRQRRHQLRQTHYTEAAIYDVARAADFVIDVALPAYGVDALSLSPVHSFTKHACQAFTLLAGMGIEGDAHCGATDQHMGRRKPNPLPNLRQVHLFSGELMDALLASGFAIQPGAIGENIVTRGLELVDLPLATRLSFPSGAVLELTGRRTPCRLVDRLGKGLMKALGGDGRWGERPIAGVMAIVVAGGEVRRGDAIGLHRPPGPTKALLGL